jgi:hypothetical protein
MRKTLFLLCPTDQLEPIINRQAQDAPYFYASLGNSFNADPKTLQFLKTLITSHEIKAIYFVLSRDNKIVLDALGPQRFSDIKGLKRYYSHLVALQKESQLSWSSQAAQTALVSYYLNQKINTLQHAFASTAAPSVTIRGKIYDKHAHRFYPIYSDLLCIKKPYLN